MATVLFALCCFGLSLLAGLMAVRRVAGFLRLAEQLALGLALGLILSCWVPFLISRITGGVVGGVLMPALFMAGLFIEKIRHPQAFTSLFEGYRQALRVRRHWPVLLGLLALLFFHAWGHRIHALHDLNGDGSWWSAGSGWEDYSFHAALANSFLHGDNLQSFTYPQVSGAPLGYPFLPDFQAAWLGQSGGLPDAFWAGSLFASATFLLGAFCLLRAWLGTAGRAHLALLLWHLGGGFGIAYLLEVKEQTDSLGAALLTRDYANDWTLGLHFHNLTTAVVWPMRVAFYGIAVVPALVLLLRGLINRPEQRNIPAFILAGFAAGAMPLISAHALIALTCLVPPLALGSRFWRRWPEWFAALVAGALLTVPQIMWMSRQLAHAEPPFVRSQMGWMAGWDGPRALTNYLTHMAWNTGLWITLGFLAWFVAGKTFRRETVGCWLLLALGQFVVFQPYIFDNIKIFAIACLAPAAGCALLLSRGWSGGWVSRVFTVLLVPLLTASGLSSIVNEARNPAIIIGKEGLEIARKIREATPRDAVILISPALHHPVLVASGRQVLFANVSGMTLHGLPHVLDRLGEVGRIYEGAPDAKALLRQRGVGWIVIGPMERLDFPKLNEAFLREVTEEVFSQGEWKLLKVNGFIK